MARAFERLVQKELGGQLIEPYEFEIPVLDEKTNAYAKRKQWMTCQPHPWRRSPAMLRILGCSSRRGVVQANMHTSALVVAPLRIYGDDAEGFSGKSILVVST